MDKLEQIKQFAKKYLEQEKCSAHNMDHVMRVYVNALKLAENEDVDLEVIKIAVLLHDIGGIKERNDLTGNTCHAVESAKLAEPFLKELGYPQDKIDHIKDCIISHRYRTQNKPKSLEAKIVFDADKLDAAGAIGLARAFVWVGMNNAYIYKKMDVKEYAKENLGGRLNGRIQDRTKHSPQINWETKDKHIVDYLYTDKAKKIAENRLEFSKIFFNKLEKEIQGLE